jgi:lantibiotic modifying enzyme
MEIQKILGSSISAPPQFSSGTWRPVLSSAAADAAVAIARDVAGRLRDPERVIAAADLAKKRTSFPKSVHWQPHGIAQGYAGLALLWGYLDECFPDEGWDRVGKQHLEVAAGAVEKLSHPHLGLYSGLSGLGFAAWYLSREGTRYPRMLATLDDVLLPQIRHMARQLLTREAGAGVSEFDVISGLAGVGRYLLLRRESSAVTDTLQVVLESLIALTQEENGLPRWHTPAGLMKEESWQHLYPHGNLNCGLAHGIPGPLALLALAQMAGLTVDGINEAIARAARWLREHRVDDAWGVNWTTAVPLTAEGQAMCIDGDGSGKLSGSMKAAYRVSRSAWCYGSPGVARGLWLAGRAIGERAYQDLAVEAMRAVYRRPVVERRIDSPTFCHGIAGLLNVTLRFAHNTALPVFVEAARELSRQMVSAYEPESMVGFRNLEPGGTRVEQPGLLDGAAGVAITLLAASVSVEPRWDALFLLS